MLHIRQVSKSYGEQLILSIPELKLDNGIYWLQGANGSGKTSLLKILAGLIPFEGEISINNINLRKRTTEYKKAVSYSEAEPLYPGFVTGRELIAFYQRIRKPDAKQVDQLITQFGFGRFLSAPISTYSSGMLKRLSLLLAFMGECRLILLDEPLSTLDAEAAAELPQLIGERFRKAGTGFIFSSHAPFPGNEQTLSGILCLTHGRFNALHETIG